jgi:uncharacterized membrane protein YfcA
MDKLYVVLAIVCFSMLIQSTFSFGGALVALPLLALVVDVKTATVLMTLLSCSIAAVVVARRWGDVDVKNAWRLIVSACVGIPLGILFLGRVDGSVLKIVLACTVIVFTVVSLFKLKTIRLIHANYAFIFGLISGIFGGAYNISGPPVVLYGSLVNWSSDRFRATVQSYALFTNVFAILGHYLAGNVTREVATYYACSLPILGVSVWLGSVVHRMIAGERYAVCVKVLLLILAARLLWSVVV